MRCSRREITGQKSFSPRSLVTYSILKQRSLPAKYEVRFLQTTKCITMMSLAVLDVTKATLPTFANALMLRSSDLERHQTYITSTALILKCKSGQYPISRQITDLRITRRSRSLEETFGTLEQLRKEGKFKYIGMSEPSAETLRKAAKVSSSPHSAKRRLTDR